MPYVPPKDRQLLMPLILRLKEKMLFLVERSRGGDHKLWGYLRHVAMRVLEETALNAAEQYQGKRGRRYWLVVDQAGIAMNIAFELYDRVLSKKPGGAPIWFSSPMVAGLLPAVPEDAKELNLEIDALVAEISKISGPKDITGGYDYDGAYCGMDNYSMTELAPRVFMDFACEAKLTLTWMGVEDLVKFWFMMMPEFYVLARSYEDEQIGKNGDVEVYQLMLDRLPKEQG